MQATSLIQHCSIMNNTEVLINGEGNREALWLTGHIKYHTAQYYTAQQRYTTKQRAHQIRRLLRNTQQIS